MRKSLLLFAALIMAFAVQAQDQRILHTNDVSSIWDIQNEQSATKANVQPRESVDLSNHQRCFTDEYDTYLRNLYPESFPTEEEFERWMAEKIAQLDDETMRGTFTIPYVVHVIHNGESVGSGNNILAGQVNAQMAQLNADFNRTNSDAGNTPSDFVGVAGSLGIDFIPAQVDPVGTDLAEPGIRRYDGGQASYSFSDMEALKATTQWDPTRYMNIWVANITGSLLGWAQFPSNSTLADLPSNGGASSTDGVVILTAAVGGIGTPGPGAPYDLGRTMTHEVGHWLGLKHIWGSSGCANSDFCDDTPTANNSSNNGVSPANCNYPAQNTCSDGLGDLPDMFQNYMDYSADACMNLFTQDQGARMATVLNNSIRRNELLTSTVGEGGGGDPVACETWIEPDPAEGYTVFNSEFGGAPCDDGSGCPFNQYEGWEVWSSEAYTVAGFVAGGSYTFSICNSAAGIGQGGQAWVPEFTIIAPSGAVDAFSGTSTDCDITWTASESGTYTIVINEDGFCSGGPNQNTDNGFPALTCNGTPGPSCPVVVGCEAGTLVDASAVTICSGQTATVETNGDEEIVDGGDYRWTFDNTGLDGTGGIEGPLTIFSQDPEPFTSYTFDDDLNGILSGQPTPLPPFRGTWLVIGGSYDADEVQCSEMTTGRLVTFVEEDDPACEPVVCESGTLDNTGSIELCPGEEFTLSTNGDESIPNPGGFGFILTPGTDGSGGTGAEVIITGTGASFLFDDDLDGILSGNLLPPLRGEWLITAAGYTNPADPFGSVCSETSGTLTVNFLGSSDAACLLECDDPTDVNIQNITDNSATAAITGTSDTYEYELVDIDGGGSFTGVPTGASASSTISLTSLTPDNDYEFWARGFCNNSGLLITGVMDGPLSGGTPKFVELYALEDIDNLSDYGLGSANNGGGSDGEEFSFPFALVPAGSFLYVATDSARMAEWFGVPYGGFVNGSAPSVNGDDAVELFYKGEVVDVFGEIDNDGTDEPWEHTDGWAYRVDGTGPDGNVFVLENWNFSGVDALDGETTNAGAAVPFPVGSYSESGREFSDWIGPYPFTTLPEPVCEVPEFLFPIGEVTDTTALISFVGPDVPELTMNLELVDLTAGGVFTGIPTISGLAQSDVPVLLESLTPGNDYAVYVQSDCGETISLWSEPLLFSTSDACDGVVGDSDLDPIIVPTLPYSDVQNTANPGCFTNVFSTASGPDVYYEFMTGPNADSVNVTTCSPTTVMDTWLFLYDGNGNLLGDNNNDLNCEPFRGIPLSSTVRIDVDPSTTYLAIVDGVSGSTGAFEIIIDEIEISVGICDDPTAGTADNVTTESADLSWTAGGSETSWNIEIVALCNGESFTGVADDVSATTSYDATGLTDDCDYEFYVQAVCAGDVSSWAGPFTFTTLEEVITGPANDLCDDAETITCTTSISADATDATTTGEPGDLCTFSVGPGVWYTFTGDGQQWDITADPDDSWDVEVGIYSGACGALVCEAFEDALGSDAPETATIVTELGTTYWVYVSSWASSDDFAGPFTLDVVCSDAPNVPDNDLCGDAEEIACGATVSGSTAAATDTDAPGDCATTVDGAGVWYQFTGTGEATTISLCGSSFDTKLHIYSGPCGDLICEASNDDACGTQSEIVIPDATLGTDYYIYVSGFSGATGDYTLSVTCEPLVSDCDAGTLASTETVELCPGDTVTVETNEDEIIPTGGEYAFGFVEGPDGSGGIEGGFTVTGTDNSYTFDAGLNGLLAFFGFDDLEGTWSVYGVVYDGDPDAGGVVCDTTTEVLTVQFLEAGEGACAPPPPAPENDTCTGAIAITCPAGISTTVDATGATPIDAPSGACTGSMGAGVWYTYEGDGQILDILVDPYGFDAEIQVLSGNGCGDFTVCEANVDDGFSVGDPEEILDFTTQVGTTYYIYIGSWIDSETEIDSFDLTITCEDPPSCPEPTALDVTDITPSSATLSWSAGGDETEWAIEIVNVTASGSFTGVPTVSGLTVTTYDATGLDPDSDYEFYVIANCDDQDSEWAGPEDFSTPPPPPANDLCEDAISLDCNSSVDGTSAGATFDDVGFCGTSNTAPGVWYTIEGTGGDITLSTCDAATFDTKISVFTGSCTALVCTAGNDDFGDCSGFTSEVTLPLSEPGTTYYVLVHGFSSQTGDFTLTATCADPPVCEAPTDITVNDITENSATISWTAGDDETLWNIEIVDVSGGGSFTGVPTAGSLTATTYSADDLESDNDYEVYVQAICGPGDVSPWAGPEAFTTLPPPAPENDLCGGAIPVSCNSVVSGSTTTATTTDAPGFCGTSLSSAPGIWYLLEGDGSLVTATTCNTATFDTKIGVFSGSCDDLVCVAGDDDESGCAGFTSLVSFLSEPGTNYYIYVTGFGTNTGDFDLTITCEELPENDQCAGAIEVSCDETITGSTATATNTDAPADFCGTSLTSAPGLWYVFEGTDQDVTFSLCGSSFDTKIGVFSGSCDDLACEAGNDDECGLQSEVEVRTYVGTEYYIYVTGFSSSAGDFSLSLTCEDTCSVIDVALDEIVDITCATGSGSVSITASGGVEPYTYLWSNGSTDEDLGVTEAGEYSVVVTDAEGCTMTGGPYTVNEQDRPTEIETPVVISPGCSLTGSGSVSVSIGGGTPPYSYSWSNGATTEDISGVGSGTYTLTVTDAAGCTYTTQDFVLSDENTLIELAPAVITPASCFGETDGAIDVTIGGGTPPYTYRWSNDINNEDVTGLAPGEYQLYVTDVTGCTYTSAIYVVPEPGEILIGSGTVTAAACNGEASGAVTGLNVTGGTEPYTYLWDDGTTTLDNESLTAGLHQLTVTDANGCVALSEVFEIDEAEPLYVAGLTITPADCNGSATGGIDLTIGGGTPPYSFSWDNGATSEDLVDVPAGTYVGTVTDAAGCVLVSPPLEVTEPDAIGLAAATVTPASCFGGSDGSIEITVEGGTPPYSYAWSNGATTEDIDGLEAGDYIGVITDANGCVFSSGPVTVGQADELAVSFLEITDVSCNGGSDGAIDVEITGGTPPYEYLWSNGATTQDLDGLEPGDYIGVVTDANGCTLTSPAIPVGEPAPLTISLVTVTDNICPADANGSIEITVIGGTPPYTYAWSNGGFTEDLFDLPNGVYVGTITDANGCVLVSPEVEVSSPFEVFENLPAVVTDISCAGETDGSITVSLQGGVLPYDIVWSDGQTGETATDLGSGTYTFTATDQNGCSYDFGPYEIEEPEALGVSDVVVSDASCLGGSDGIIDITVAGGTPPYSFAWSDGSTAEDATGLAPGDYVGTITDANGCVFVSPTITVGEPDTELTATAESTPASNPGASDGTVTVTVSGGTAPYTFDWNSGDVTQNLEGLGGGTYCVDITDANGCTIEICQTVGVGTAIGDLFNLSSLVLYPNPTRTSSRLEVTFGTATDLQVEVVDVLGRVLEARSYQSVTQEEMVFDVREFAAGTYLIRLSAKGESVTLPLIVQH